MGRSNIYRSRYEWDYLFTVHKAIWIDGHIWFRNIDRNKYYENGYMDIVLKCLNNSQNLSTDFLQELCSLYLLLILYFFEK